MALRTIARKDRKNIRNAQRTPHKSALRTSKSPLFRSRLPTPAIPGRNRGCARPGENAGPMPARPPAVGGASDPFGPQPPAAGACPFRTPFRRSRPPSGIAPAISETRQEPGRNPTDPRQISGRLLSKSPAESRQASGKNTTRHQQNPGKNAAEERQPPSRPQPRRAAQKRGRQPDALPSPRSPVGTKLRETPPEQRRARMIRQTGGRGRSKPYRENRPATRNDPESGSQNRLGRPIIA